MFVRLKEMTSLNGLVPAGGEFHVAARESDDNQVRFPDLGARVLRIVELEGGCAGGFLL